MEDGKPAGTNGDGATDEASAFVGGGGRDPATTSAKVLATFLAGDDTDGGGGAGLRKSESEGLPFEAVRFLDVHSGLWRRPEPEVDGFRAASAAPEVVFLATSAAPEVDFEDAGDLPDGFGLASALPETAGQLDSVGLESVDFPLPIPLPLRLFLHLDLERLDESDF